MKTLRRLVATLFITSLASAQTPAPHTPRTIHVDGARYDLAHLDHFEPGFVTVVHQGGRTVVRWENLDPALQAEYAPEHQAALIACQPHPSPIRRDIANSAFPAAAAPKGEDIKLNDGTLFRDAVVLSSNPASITIRHRTGVIRLDVATISEDDRAKIAPGYDAQKAAAYKVAEAGAEDRAAQASADQAAIDRFDATAINFSGTIKQVVDGGVLMEGSGRTDDQTKDVIMNGTSMKVATIPGQSTYFKDVFVAGTGGSSVDGDNWSGRAWPAGRYQYTTVMGATRTIPRLAVSRELALHLLGSNK